jgi:hypothetical protein
MSQESTAATTIYRFKRFFTHPIYEQIEGMVSPSSSDEVSPEDMILATEGITKSIVRLCKIVPDTEEARGGESSDTTGGVGSVKDVTL